VSVALAVLATFIFVHRRHGAAQAES
jgi:hypothetical protein